MEMGRANHVHATSPARLQPTPEEFPAWGKKFLGWERGGSRLEKKVSSLEKRGFQARNQSAPPQSHPAAVYRAHSLAGGRPGGTHFARGDCSLSRETGEDWGGGLPTAPSQSPPLRRGEVWWYPLRRGGPGWGPLYAIRLSRTRTISSRTASICPSTCRLVKRITV
jgi:hypothetical protein